MRTLVYRTSPVRKKTKQRGSASHGIRSIGDFSHVAAKSRRDIRMGRSGKRSSRFVR